MAKHWLAAILISGNMFISCINNTDKSDNTNTPVANDKGSFGYDLSFLQKYDSVVVLKHDDEPACVIVSPRYQAKVFTSTADGDKGQSFGWINYKAFDAPVDAHMNAYGGENRFWLGPEGGPFSLYFRKGDSMIFDNWKTPPPIDTENWDVVHKTKKSVTLQKDMQLSNYKGTALTLRAERTVSVFSLKEIMNHLNVPIDSSIKAVGYLTDNSVTNTGRQEWNEQTGAPCIWMLDMFNPSPSTVILIPYKNNTATENSKVATTDYFGEIPEDRIKYKNNVLLFKADGKSRGKLGIGPSRALPVAGSYDAQRGVLTITTFDVDPKGRYLNQEWSTAKDPFSGDAVNAYNDGPLADGTQMGPFYEIESVSPAAFLQPGASISHRHAVYHFTGSKNSLNTIAKKLFSISLEDIETAF